MKQKLYPDNLWEEIIKKRKYIPRRLKEGERLKLYRKYWIPEYGIVKVKEIINLDPDEHYSVTYSNGNMFGVIPYPTYINCFELLSNLEGFEKSDFINKKKAIYGAEIKYWFLINNIDESDENYSGFIDKIPYLKDSTLYIVHRNKKRHEYDFIIKK